MKEVLWSLWRLFFNDAIEINERCFVRLFKEIKQNIHIGSNTCCKNIRDMIDS